MRAPDIATRAMTPEDAAAVRALMLRCYGDTYFDDLYYDPDALACYIWVDALGEDLLARIALISQECERGGTRALYLNLPLDGGVTDALRMSCPPRLGAR